MDTRQEQSKIFIQEDYYRPAPRRYEYEYNNRQTRAEEPSPTEPTTSTTTALIDNVEAQVFEEQEMVEVVKKRTLAAAAAKKQSSDVVATKPEVSSTTTSSSSVSTSLPEPVLSPDRVLLMGAGIIGIGMIGFYSIPGLMKDNATGSGLVNSFYCAVMTLTT